MLQLLVSFAAFVLSFAIAARMLDGMKVNGGVGAHIGGALVYGILSTLCAWILVLVIGLFTLGAGLILAPLTYLVANAILLIVASKLTDRLTVDGFWTALKASLLMAIFGWVARHTVNVFF